MIVEENYGYILRISKDSWEKQVFDIKKYYTAVRRKWHRGTNILLARKTEVGDSFIGYGVVGKVEHLWELSPEEETYCQVKPDSRCITNVLKRARKP